MNRTEAAGLLAIVASYDQRTLGETDVASWQAALYDVDLTDATAAVIAHHRESVQRCSPAHVLARVRALRSARLPRESADPLPGGDPDDTESYRRQLAEYRAAKASGRVPGLASLPPGRPLVASESGRGGEPVLLGRTAAMHRARAELDGVLAARRRDREPSEEGSE